MTKSPPRKPNAADVPFSPLLAPLVERAAGDLETCLELMQGMAISPSAMASAHNDLLVTLSGVSGLCLQTEFEGSQGRFSEFLEAQRSTDPWDLCFTYPGLPALLEGVVVSWAREMHAISLAALDLVPSGGAGGKGPGTTPRIEGIRLGLSDRHGGGRTVADVRLSDGRRFAFKPRSLAPEMLFLRLGAWLAERQRGPKIAQPWILDRGTHGWMEWIEAKPVHSEEEAERYFRRAGSILLLLYIVSAVDCHAENLIASGEHPVLVDLEGIGHPQTEISSPEADDEGVLGTGFLPYWKHAYGAWIGMGGLGSPGVSTTPWAGAQWVEVNSDAMRLHFRPESVQARNNLPVLRGAAIPPHAHLESLLMGFLDAGRAVLKDRSGLVGRGGPLDGAEGVPTRFLARATTAYVQAIEALVQPDSLRDEEGMRRRVAEHLDRAPYPPSIPDADSRRNLASAEAKALLALDVPRFERRLGDMEISLGEEPVAVGEGPTGLERILDRIAGLSEAVLQEQAELIRAAVVLSQVVETGAGKMAGDPDPPPRYSPFRTPR